MRVFDYITAFLQDSQKVLDVFLFAFAVFIETKRRYTDASELASNKAELKKCVADPRSYGWWKAFKKDGQELYPDKFAAQYFGGLRRNIMCFPSIIDFIDTGFFDAQKVSSEIAQYLDSIKDEPKSAKLTYKYWELSDSECDYEYKATLQRIQEGKIPNQELLLKLLLAFMYYYDIGIIEPNLESLKEIFLSGIEHSKDKWQYQTLQAQISSSSEPTNEQYQLIKNRILEENCILLYKDNRSKAEKLLHILKPELPNFTEELHNLNHDYGAIPLIKYLGSVHIKCG